MENAVRQRIVMYIRDMNITVNAISKSMGYPQSNLNKQINGTTTISLPTLLVFLDYAKDVSLDWLIAGKGKMLKTHPSSGEVASTNTNGNSGGVNGNIIGGVNGNINGNGNQVGIIPSDCEKELVKAQFESDHLRKEVKSLKEQLKQALSDKEKAISDKDMAMSMLNKALSK